MPSTSLIRKRSWSKSRVGSASLAKPADHTPTFDPQIHVPDFATTVRTDMIRRVSVWGGGGGGGGGPPPRHGGRHVCSAK